MRHPDASGHSQTLRREITQLRAIHARRTNVLGVEPENVAVVEFAHRLPPDEAGLRQAGLRVLDWFDNRVVVTAADDPGLERFVGRLAAYGAPRADGYAGEKTPADDETDDVRTPAAPLQSFFDRIEHVRALGPEEVLTEAASGAIDSAEPQDVLTLDLQCWCPEDEAEARLRHDRVIQAVEAADGRVLDRTLRHRAGLSLLRVEASAVVAAQLAGLGDLRRIDRLPRPLITHIEMLGSRAENLPVVLAPAPDAPIVAVVDSGVRSSHPLIAPAFVGHVAIGGIEAESDDSGHGTFVASLVLHGSLEPLLARPHEAVEPACRLLSIRVLDQHNAFRDEALWENDLVWALNQAADEGARIINLSIGDPRRPYEAARPTALAAVVDDVVRTRGVVVVVSSGNVGPTDHQLSEDDDFTGRLLDSSDTGLLDPATSALSLTTGALGGDDEQGVRAARTLVDVRPFGRSDVPSPLTRRGPGASSMIKPEVAAPGGHLVRSDTDRYPRTSPSTGVVGAGGTHPERVLATGAGTSYAAALVTHVAARTLARNPGLSGRAVRALVMASVIPLPSYLEPGDAPSRVRERQLSGYGRPDVARAAWSTDHRAVLVAEESLLVDDVHLYTVPVPDSFFASGGWRRLTVSLAFDPLTRSTRLDYLGSRMQVHVYVGVSVDEVAGAYIAQRSGPSAPDLLERHELDGSPPDDAEVAGPASLSRWRLDLQPPSAQRSRGAHLFGTSVRSTRMERERGEQLVIAVQNRNRWSPASTVEPYALAVVLERDPAHGEIYAQLQAAVEVETAIELETQV